MPYALAEFADIIGVIIERSQIVCNLFLWSCQSSVVTIDRVCGKKNFVLSFTASGVLLQGSSVLEQCCFNS